MKISLFSKHSKSYIIDAPAVSFKREKMEVYGVPESVFKRIRIDLDNANLEEGNWCIVKIDGEDYGDRIVTFNL